MDGSEAARRMFGSCGGDAFRNMAIMNPIMMRFRPIAPKPVVGGSISGGASSVESKNSLISKGRTKRKYVRVRRYNRRKKTVPSSEGNKNNSEFPDQIAVTTTTAARTLQLLPERRVEFDLELGCPVIRRKSESDVVAANSDLDLRRRGVVELWVRVGCVTDACMEEEDIGCTDEERIKNLEGDTCPGFVSDGMNRVKWLNKAFKRMVRQRQRSEGDQSQSESPAEIGVWLITKPIVVRRRCFTCQIKLQFKWGTKMEKDSKVVPCDAWRMDGGGFAWKLDVKAALTLAPLLQED